jgi:hypothetical protein
MGSILACLPWHWHVLLLLYAWQGCRVHDARLEPAWMVNHVTNLGLKIVVIDT